MMKTNLSRISQLRSCALLLGGWLLAAGAAHGQSADSLGSIARKLRQYEQRGPHEKLFLHLDRPVYLSGETMWFKAYVTDGTLGRPLALSSVAYVEVLNADHQPVLQGKVPMQHGSGQGSFVLPTTLPAGTYSVRAYTNWMKNFRPEAFFHGTVTVINTFVASGAGAKDSAAFDAQFFPEGGNLVRGLRSRVALKVTDKSGKGLATTGKVLSETGAVVATFGTQRLGMGTFELTPTAGPYTATVTLPNGKVLRRELPRVFEQGHVLRLDDTSPQQLTVRVSSTSTQPETVYLLAHSRQKTAVATRLEMANGQATLVVNKFDLLDGVSHFTLFTANQKPVCERLYFQAPKKRLAITAQPDKGQYGARSKVSLRVSSADDQTPLPADLSVAVYRLDSLAKGPGPAIDRYLWLAADLQGTVENPDYYFTATGPEAAQAADQLMLTQGWSRFRWEDVLGSTPAAFDYVPELYGPLVQARLTRPGTNAPRQGVLAYLSSPSRITRLSASQSNAQGLVQFEPAQFEGPHEVIVQTDPAQDSTCRITLLEAYSTKYRAGALPAFGLSSRFQADYVKRHFQAQVQNVYSGKYRNLFARERVDSTAFFGPPDELYMLDKYTRFKVMEEVLREYVPGVLVRIRKDGFHLLVVDRVNKTVLQENPMVLLDGTPVFNVNKIMAMNPLKIQKLEVIDGRYFHGQAIYNGIVSFTTYKGDLEGFPLDAHALVQEYEGVQRQREFYAPRYDTPQAQQSRLPDLRNLLYWNPSVRTTGGQPQTLDFYTGDQTGRYLVVVQGLAANGLAGSTSTVLEVKPTL